MHVKRSLAGFPVNESRIKWWMVVAWVFKTRKEFPLLWNLRRLRVVSRVVRPRRGVTVLLLDSVDIDHLATRPYIFRDRCPCPLPAIPDDVTIREVSWYEDVIPASVSPRMGDLGSSPHVRSFLMAHYIIAKSPRLKKLRASATLYYF